MPRQKAPGHLYSVYMTSYANDEVIHTEQPGDLF